MSDDAVHQVSYVARKHQLLAGETTRWAVEVGKSLVRLENLKRLHRGTPPIEAQPFIPSNGENGLRLLNLKVWSLRYSVNLDFILAFLLDVYFAKIRRKPDGDDLRLGVSIATLTGNKARQALEEEITKVFPGGENIRAAREEARRLVHPIDPLGILPAGDDMIAAYEAAMNKRLRLRRARFTSKRAWRGNPDPVVVRGKDDE